MRLLQTPSVEIEKQPNEKRKTPNGLKTVRASISFKFILHTNCYSFHFISSVVAWHFIWRMNVMLLKNKYKEEAAAEVER